MPWAERIVKSGGLFGCAGAGNAAGGLDGCAGAVIAPLPHRAHRLIFPDPASARSPTPATTFRGYQRASRAARRTFVDWQYACHFYCR